MDNFLHLLKLLRNADVKFVVIGGFASAVHGCTNVTQDIDICCDFSTANLLRLQQALDDINPLHRMATEKIRLELTEENCSDYKNLYLDTDYGQLDCLGFVNGVGNYEKAIEMSVKIEVDQDVFIVLNIDALIESKKAMDRSKDRQTIIELKALKEKNRDG